MNKMMFLITTFKTKTIVISRGVECTDGELDIFKTPFGSDIFSANSPSFESMLLFS